MVKLDNWSVVFTGDAYTAPECRTPHLNGDVTGHPRFEDGKNITTTRIKEVNGRVIKTRNTSYELGEAHESYVEWCRKNEYKLDYNNPIKRKENTNAESS